MSEIGNDLILFFKSGNFCKEFGHDYDNTVYPYDSGSIISEKFICKFCKKEYGV